MRIYLVFFVACMFFLISFFVSSEMSEIKVLGANVEDGILYVKLSKRMIDPTDSGCEYAVAKLHMYFESLPDSVQYLEVLNDGWIPVPHRVNREILGQMLTE